MALFQELGAFKCMHLVCRELLCALESGGKALVETCVKLLPSSFRHAFRRAVSKSQECLKTSCWRVPWVEVLGTDGGQKSKQKIELDEDEKLAELILVATRKDWGAFEVVDFWREPWGVYSVFILEDVVSDACDVTSAPFPAVPFKIVPRKA